MFRGSPVLCHFVRLWGPVCSVAPIPTAVGLGPSQRDRVSQSQRLCGPLPAEAVTGWQVQKMRVPFGSRQSDAMLAKWRRVFPPFVCFTVILCELAVGVCHGTEAHGTVTASTGHARLPGSLEKSVHDLGWGAKGPGPPQRDLPEHGTKTPVAEQAGDAGQPRTRASVESVTRSKGWALLLLAPSPRAGWGAGVWAGVCASLCCLRPSTVACLGEPGSAAPSPLPATLCVCSWPRSPGNSGD